VSRQPDTPPLLEPAPLDPRLLDPQLLDDVRCILTLSPEDRLREVAAISRFTVGARLVSRVSARSGATLFHVGTP
jgi:hypothetical protein